MKNHFIVIFATLFILSCTKNMEKPSMNPPIAKKIEHQQMVHGDTLKDNYFWMRLTDEQKEAKTPDAQTQDVLDYLNAENDYLANAMADTEDLQKDLYDEIVARIKQDESSVPVTDNGYSYYSRYEKGADYPLHCRKKLGSETEEILINGPEMGKGKEYFGLGTYTVSEDNELLAYSVDYVSRRNYTIYVKNLKTGKIFEETIENTSGGITWANDNKTIFYTKNDPQTLRSDKIYKHVLGTPVSDDKLVFHEKDETFNTFIYKTKSKKYLMIGSSQTLSTEFQFLDANTPDGEWQYIQKRERNLEYHVDHYQDHFYITTNLDAKNFRLMKAPVSAPQKSNWEEVIAHRENVYLSGIDIFNDYLVVNERKDGLRQINIIKWADNSNHYIEFDDPAYTTYTFANVDFNTDSLRVSYTSLTTPSMVFDYNMTTRKRTVKKQQEVLGGKFNASDYVSERLMAPSRDGDTQIPISLVYKKGTDLNAETPLLLYSYGSYGNSSNPYFSSVRLSLLDRGFVYAIAHIRGGQEMGRDWYDNGKLLKKKNTFYDFIDCGEFLVDKNYTSPDHMYANGGSAGGLLMGAVLNMAPQLWNGVIADVPFVDVINTMLDETIPLTTFEFDEWGNPKDKEYYDYMMSYSPYDNVEKKEYPNIFITTGYWDSQVQYWEPAKWIAKLRDYKTDDNLLIMKCNMEVGHGGASARFEKYKDVALDYAFLLKLEGITE